METNKHIDQRLAESIRIALRDFGEGILMENRMMGVLKDYQGFWDFPQGEFIVRTLIADGTLARIYELYNNKNGTRHGHLNRETQRIARQYGFSYSLINTVLFSFLKGMGISDESNTHKHNDSNKELAQSTTSHIILDKQKIPKTKSARQGTNSISNQPPYDSYNLLKFVIGWIIITIISIAAIILVQVHSKDVQVNQNSGSLPNLNIAVDSLIKEEFSYIDNDTIQFKTSKDDTPVDQKVKSTEKPNEKEKPIDPRFQYPDGTYKQPSEYMKYFNEDYEDEESDDGYEDGYDDALDE